MNDRDKYNGWTNKPTWLVNLWLTNDEGGQAWLDEQVQECLDDAEGNEAEAAADLAMRLEYLHDEGLGEISGLTGVWSDLMSWALAHVDWREIAENHVGDAIEQWREDHPEEPDFDDPEPHELTDEQIERSENDYERMLEERGS